MSSAATASSGYVSATCAMASTPTKYKVIFFAPPAAALKCKAAIFATGAGKVGEYTEVHFTTTGVGSFRPTMAARPHIGTPGQVEELEEVKVEIPCLGGAEEVRRVVEAIRMTHPYEEAVYEVYKMEDF